MRHQRLLLLLLSLALCAALLCGCHSDGIDLSPADAVVRPSAAPISAQANEEFRGDLDGSGTPGVNDAVGILRIVVGHDAGHRLADCDGDLATAVNDAIMVLRCVVGLDPWPIGGGPVCYLVALGDSITNAMNPALNLLGDHPEYSFAVGTQIESVYTALRDAGENVIPVRLAVSGATSADCLSAQAPEVAQYHPKYITLLMGGNDLMRMVPEATYRANMEAIAAAIKADGCTVLMGIHPNYIRMREANTPACLLPPLTPEQRQFYADNLVVYNQICAEIAVDNDFTVVDLYPHLNESHISAVDCIHPNVAGLTVIATHFIAAL